LIALFTSSASAAVVLDQQNDLTGSGTADSTSGGYTENAQTFTVGVTGTLARIEIQAVRFFGSEGNLIVSVYNTTGNTEATRFPDSTSLASRSMAFNLVPTTGYAYQVFDFTSSAIPVTAGTVMAFGVGSTANSATGGIRSSFDQNTYAGGKAVNRVANPNGPWQNFPVQHDYGFKIYVDSAAPVATPGDFNADGAVDAADYPLWRKFLNDPSEAALNGNGDGMNGVDDGDYNLWRAHFAEPASGQAGQVPEPGTALIYLMPTLLALLPARRRN
jgi:hypothetical protein